MSKPFLIMGVDPGTTTGFAAFDLDGNLRGSGSSKSIDFEELVRKTIELGHPLLVGADKAKLPSFVDSFATSFGAKTVTPSEDLSKESKQELLEECVKVSGIDLSGRSDHERDAMAAAWFARKEYRSLIRRVERFCRRDDCSELRDEILELVIKENFSIHGAAHALLNEDVDDPATDEVLEKEREVTREDVQRMYNRLVEKRRENELLKKRVSSLEKELESAKSESENPKPTAKDIRIKRDQLLRQKERRIKSLDSKIRGLKKKNEKYQDKIDELYQRLANARDILVMKKVKNLGSDELGSLEDRLGIREGDVLLVDDADVWSESGIDLLTGKVSVIVAKKASRSTKRRLPLVIIPDKKLDLDENPVFGFVDRRRFGEVKDQTEVFRQIVEEYKRSRKKD